MKKARVERLAHEPASGGFQRLERPLAREIISKSCAARILMACLGAADDRGG